MSNIIDKIRLSGIDYTLSATTSGISSAECQTMIDNSISGKADSDDVYTTGQTSGATELATAFAATQPKLSAGTGISIDANNVISATGGGGGGSYTPGDGIDITNNVISVTGMVETSAVTSAVTSGSTDVLTSGGAYEQFGGLKLIKLTQAEYDALSPNYDSNTLYVING